MTITAIHRVTHGEDHAREARFWACRTIAERVIAGWALADNSLVRRENHEPETRSSFTLSRVASPRR